MEWALVAIIMRPPEVIRSQKKKTGLSANPETSHIYTTALPYLYGCNEDEYKALTAFQRAMPENQSAFHVAQALT